MYILILPASAVRYTTGNNKYELECELEVH